MIPFPHALRHTAVFTFCGDLRQNNYSKDKSLRHVILEFVLN